MKAIYWAAVAMACAAILGAIGQVFLKKANVQFDVSMLTNKWLIFGLSLYGIGFVINVISYRYGSPSVLYPVISLSYVAVVFFAAWLLGDVITVQKVVGSLVIVGGVVIMFL